MSNINAVSNTIIENRYIAVIQLTADDMGGTGCKNWDDYRLVCDKLAKEAYNHAVGRSVDANLIGVLISNLFNFFGVETVDSSKYHARILTALVERKAQYSEEFKEARKAKNSAKKVYDEALEDESKTDDEIATLKEAYDNAVNLVDKLKLESKNYWFDPVPMLDKSKKHATAKARKNLEDTCADIISERQFMSAEELEHEAQKLADERKGRAMRKRAEKKALKEAEKAAEAQA